jgi:hypothetical protein
LQCLIDTSKAVVECAATYWEGKQRVVVYVTIYRYNNIIYILRLTSKRLFTLQYRGADDLVPIVSYVIIKAAVRNMHAEISLVEEFIPETMMIAEAGMPFLFLFPSHSLTFRLLFSSFDFPCRVLSFHIPNVLILYPIA